MTHLKVKGIVIYLDDGSSKYLRNAVTHFPHYIPQPSIPQEKKDETKG